MEIATSLLITLGSSITKSILKIWLEDDPVKRDLSKDLVKFIESKLKDRYKIKDLARQSDELSDKISLSLAHFFNDKLSKDENTEVAQLVANSIDNLKVTSKLLIKNRFDVNVINKLLQENSFTPNEESRKFNFNKRQNDLFDLLLKESARLIVDISSQLPSFKEHTTASIIQNQKVLTNTGSEILEEIRKIRSSIPDNDLVENKFEENYRRLIVRKYDILELFGLDASNTIKRYSLSLAYINIGLENYSASEDSIDIINILQDSNLNVVTGYAGSGKTTLLQWLAVNIAGKRLEHHYSELNSYVPILVKLRSFDHGELPVLNDVIEKFSATYGENMPKWWVNNQLKLGKVCLLIDGLDEINFDTRIKVIEWIQNLIQKNSGNKLVITSRPYALEDLNIPTTYNKFIMQDMMISDINHFIDHWHSAYEDKIDSKTLLKESKELNINLKAELQKNKNLLRLAINPLMCALICTLNKERLSKLPSDRISLYKSCLDMFYRRDLERNVHLSDYVDIGTRQKEFILSDLAYWFVRNGKSEAYKKDVVHRVRVKLRSLDNLPLSCKPSDLVKYFLERSGVLREPSLNKVDFPHRTFEEYLAAVAIVYEGDYGLLKKNIHNYQWREVVILTCGLARSHESKDIITFILASKTDINSDSEYLTLLATACSELVLDLPSETRSAVKKSLATVIPPKNMTQAKEISKLGDFVVTHLTYKKNKRKPLKHIRPIIRTLAMMGSNVYPILSEYSNDHRHGVKEELIHSSKYCIQPSKYGEEIFSNFTSLRLKGKFSLELFANVTTLKGLSLDLDFIDHHNLDFIKKLTSLEWLTLGWAKNQLDCRVFENNNSIKELCFMHCHMGFSNQNALTTMKKLERLKIPQSFFIDIESFKMLSDLKSLELPIQLVERSEKDLYELIERIDQLILSTPGYGLNTNEKYSSIFERLKKAYPNTVIILA
ncbi:MAG: NACHT domain-containing protein [Nonlabens sp.]